MRVICVDNSAGVYGHGAFLVEGNGYNVFQCPTHPDGYKVQGLLYDPRNGRHISFAKSRFIPLSEIEELSIVNLETEKV